MESATLSDGARRGRDDAERRGARLGGVALRNELMKMNSRPATLVTVGFLLLVNGLNFGRSWWTARGSAEESFALPAAWPEIVTGNAQGTLIFGSVLLILLVASEFSWRTARQNVIDGLSKEAWFRGKLYLMVVLGFVLLLLQAGAGGAFAAAGTDPLTLGAVLPDTYHVSAMGGFLLGFLGYGSLALLLAVSIRGTGASIGVWFLYVAVVERLVGGGLARLGGVAEQAARYLPRAVFDQLLSYVQHDPAALAQATARAAAAGRPPPEPWSWSVLLPVALGWILVFVVASHVIFVQRDL